MLKQNRFVTESDLKTGRYNQGIELVSGDRSTLQPHAEGKIAVPGWSGGFACISLKRAEYGAISNSGKSKKSMVFFT
jgi:hypothetical protein